MHRVYAVCGGLPSQGSAADVPRVDAGMPAGLAGQRQSTCSFELGHGGWYCCFVSWNCRVRQGSGILELRRACGCVPSARAARQRGAASDAVRSGAEIGKNSLVFGCWSLEKSKILEGCRGVCQLHGKQDLLDGRSDRRYVGLAKDQRPTANDLLMGCYGLNV